MGISTLMQFWGREISYGYISDKALEIKDIHKPSGHIFRFWTFFSIILFYEVLPIFAQIETIILQLSVNTARVMDTPKEKFTTFISTLES